MLWPDPPTNYPWYICSLAHTREKRYWPVCSWLLLACLLALCFCPHAMASEPLESARHFSAFFTSSWLLFTRKKSQYSKELVPLDHVFQGKGEGGRFRDQESDSDLLQETGVITLCPLVPSSPKNVALLVWCETEHIHSHVFISE